MDISIVFPDISLINPMRSLGKVNIICGPNSSGKSTVLNYISEGKFDLCSDFESLTEWFSQTNGVTRDLIAEVVSNLLEEDNQFSDNLIPLDKFGSLLAQRVSIDSPEDLEAVRSKCLEINNKTERIRTSGMVIPSSRSLSCTYKVSGEIPSMDLQGTKFLSIYFRSCNVDDDNLSVPFQWIKESFRSVTDGVDFDLKLQGHTNDTFDLVFKFPGGGSQLANKCGSGLCISLLLLAVAKLHHAPTLFIEEPETNLHPELLSRVFEKIIDGTDKTLFLTTHSSILLRPDIADRVYMCRFKDHKINISDQTSKSIILSELGYSVLDNLTSGIVIFVEGPHDIKAIRYLINEMVGNRFPINSFYFWPLGGDMMRHINVAPIAEGKKVFAILDGESNQVAVDARREFGRNCREAGCKLFELSRYSIECYWSRDAYFQLFAKHLDDPEWNVPHDGTIKNILPKNYKSKSLELARITGVDGLGGTDLHRFLSEIVSAIVSV